MTYGPGTGEVYPRPIDVDPDEQTDLDPQITDHPFKPAPLEANWEDVCAHIDADGWPCGYSRDEHERLEGAAEEVRPPARPPDQTATAT